MSANFGIGRSLRSTTDPQSHDHYQFKPAFSIDPLNSLENTNIGKRVRISKFARFLDLPPELRLQVYGYFADVPALYPLRVEQEAPLLPDSEREHRSKLLRSPTRNALKTEHKAIVQTRKSLLLACRQISAEFVHIFYRTITVIVHAEQPPIPNPWYKPTSKATSNADIKWIIGRATPRDFYSRFLRTLAPSKISNIRHLHYDASLFEAKLIRHPYRFPFDNYPHRHYRAADATNVDFQGLVELSTLLAREKPALTALEEVVLYGCGDVDACSTYVLSRHQPITPEEIWSKAGERCAWNLIEGLMVGAQCAWKLVSALMDGGRGALSLVQRNMVEGFKGCEWNLVEGSMVGDAETSGPLAGWDIERAVSLHGSRPELCVDQVSVTFRKPQATQSAQTSGAAAGGASSTTPRVELRVEYDPGYSYLDFYGNPIAHGQCSTESYSVTQSESEVRDIAYHQIQ